MRIYIMCDAVLRMISAENAKFHYEPGKTYEYLYTADTTSKMNGADSDLAGMHIRATAKVEVIAPCDMTLKVTGHGLQNAFLKFTSRSNIWSIDRSIDRFIDRSIDRSNDRVSMTTFRYWLLRILSVTTSGAACVTANSSMWRHFLVGFNQSMN